MSKQTEVYMCSRVPEMAPEFIDPHITIEGKKFLIELDPDHPYVKAANLIGQTNIDLLRRYGIKNPELMYKGDKPNF